MNIIKGLFLIFLGVAIIIGGFSIGCAWLAFCFGSVIVGVLLLFIAPTILFLPFSLSFSPGLGFVILGFMLIKDPDKN